MPSLTEEISTRYPTSSSPSWSFAPISLYFCADSLLYPLRILDCTDAGMLLMEGPHRPFPLFFFPLSADTENFHLFSNHRKESQQRGHFYVIFLFSDLDGHSDADRHLTTPYDCVSGHVRTM